MLFGGISIYFTGHTDKVGAYQLKQHVQKNGGKVNYAFSVTHTSHIVCTNLCASKLKSFSTTRPLKKKIHVVHPDWIIESIKAGVLQPESKYEIVVTRDTSSILDFLPSAGGEKTSSKSEAELLGSDASSPPSETPDPNPCATSLSISTDESQGSQKPYKPVTHPLLHTRRSSASTYEEPKIEHVSRDNVRKVQRSMKQQRINSIMKRAQVANAQKSFR